MWETLMQREKIHSTLYLQFIVHNNSNGKYGKSIWMF